MRRWTWAATIALGLLSVAAGLGSLGQPFEMVGNFRVQIAICAVAFAVGIGVARHGRALAVCSAIVLINAVIVALPFCAGVRHDPPAPVMTRIVWANLYRQQSALDRLAAVARDAHADRVAVTEVPPSGEAGIRRALPDFPCVVFTADNGNPFAVAIASRRPCVVGGDLPSVRYIDVDGLRLVAIHSRPPWDNDRTAQRNAVIDKGFDLAATVRQGILVGDFNATPWSPVFSTGMRHGMIMAPCGGPLAPTWRSTHALFGLKIDQVYVTPSLTVTTCRRGPDIGSDHRPLIFEVTPAR